MEKFFFNLILFLFFFKKIILALLKQKIVFILFCRTNYDDVKIETDDKMSTKFAFKGLFFSTLITVQKRCDCFGVGWLCWMSDRRSICAEQFIIFLFWNLVLFLYNSTPFQLVLWKNTEKPFNIFNSISRTPRIVMINKKHQLHGVFWFISTEFSRFTPSVALPHSSPVYFAFLWLL